MSSESFVRQALDSENCLPDVSLEPLDTNTLNGLGLHLITHQGETVGRVMVRQTTDNERSISSIAVRPDKRLLGYGLAAHVEVIEIAHKHGASLRNDQVLTAGSAAIWQKFIAAGLVEIIQPLYRIVHTVDNKEKEAYSGYVRINPHTAT
jgi:GNAT superfamily N-acetyltransferase